MTTTSTKKAAPKTEQPNLALEITHKLEVALESYKELWGEKKFRNKIKKACKIFLKVKSKESPAKKDGATAKKKAAAPKKATPKKQSAAKKAAPAKKQAPVKKQAPAKKSAPVKK